MGAERIVAVLSGKGGVGKTTVSVGLALALRDRGQRVGLLDADLYGPDVPRFMGLTRTVEARNLTLWTRSGSRPPEPLERFGIRVWSSQFLVSEDQSLTLEAPLAGLLLDRAFGRVNWGDLDWLVVDLPPGTADLQQRLGSLGVGAAIITVTPQDVSHLDARKVLTMLKERSIRVLGGVENMAAMTCPHCSEAVELYRPTRPDRTIWAAGVEKLVSLPFDAVLAERAEEGRPLVAGDGDAVSGAFATLAGRVDAAYGP